MPKKKSAKEPNGKSRKIQAMRLSELSSESSEDVKLDEPEAKEPDDEWDSWNLDDYDPDNWKECKHKNIHNNACDSCGMDFV